MFRNIFVAISLAVVSLPAASADNQLLGFSKLWTYHHTQLKQTAEIPAYDPLTNTLWIAGLVGVDVLDASNGELVKHIDVSSYGTINSVAVHDGLAAFAIAHKSSKDHDNSDRPGLVLFVDTHSYSLSSGPNPIKVGLLPDMLTFSPDGRYLLVANEGTTNKTAEKTAVSNQSHGSISVIDVPTRTVFATLTFNGVPVSGSNLRTPEAAGIDFEPEYITVDSDNLHAYVSLQEANGVAVLDLQAMQFTKLVGLGLKDFSLADNGFGHSNYIVPPAPASNASNGDRRKEMHALPVKGLYQPDAIASFHYQGKTYLAMANEGDAREDGSDKVRAEEFEGTPNELKRLNVSLPDSTPGNLVTFGGHSFSVRDEAGNLVYDSGSLLDAEAMARGIYDDSRSEDRGVEPEGLALINIGGRTYAFVGLERTTQGAVAVFDITVPESTYFVDMIVTEDDVGPEGLAAYQAGDRYYLAIANEVSKTTTVYRVNLNNFYNQPTFQASISGHQNTAP
jgi:hypothetical protein